MNQGRDRIELLRGTLDMLILRTLLVQIAQHIQRSTEDGLQVEHGSLYPTLHRLERRGWLASKWESADGRKQLAVQESKWKRLAGAIARVAAQAES